MGNQREIRQVVPSAQLGVAIPIRDGCVDAVAGLLAKHEVGHFYTYIAEPGADYIISNMDYGKTPIGTSDTARFIIQSGGKMWCGYEAFCDHIANVAKYLHDAHFFVGDELDYIDKFRITNGKLHYKRVHSGYWLAVDEYLMNKQGCQNN